MSELELLRRADAQEVILRMAYLIEGIYKRGSAIGIDPAYMAELSAMGRRVAYEQMRDQIDAEKVA